jgi:hypothetical protein
MHAAQRLHTLGIAVRYTDMPVEGVGDLDEDAGVLWVRAGADPDDQVWVMTEAWNFIAIGAHASPTAKIQPKLQLVPAPRAASDELPA